MTYHDHIDNILPKVDYSPLQKSKVGILPAIIAALLRLGDVLW